MQKLEDPKKYLKTFQNQKYSRKFESHKKIVKKCANMKSRALSNLKPKK